MTQNSFSLAFLGKAFGVLLALQQILAHRRKALSVFVLFFPPSASFWSKGSTTFFQPPWVLKVDRFKGIYLYCGERMSTLALFCLQKLLRLSRAPAAGSRRSALWRCPASPPLDSRRLPSGPPQAPLWPLLSELPLPSVMNSAWFSRANR